MAFFPTLSGQGKDALPFTRTDRNPVTSALAGAGGASYSGAWNAFGNQAALVFLEGKGDGSVSYQYWAPDAASHAAGAAAVRISNRIVLSAGYAFQAGKSMDVLDQYGQPAGSFAPKGHLIALGAGFAITDKIGLGAGARYALQQMAPESGASGFSADVFMSYRPIETLRFLAGVSTIGPKVAASGGKAFSQPSSVKAAAAWDLPLGDHAISLMADADYFFSGSLAASAGMEYSWNDMVFVRCGYRLAKDDCVIPGHLGLGAGVKLWGFHLDLSWLTASPVLGNTVTAGIGYSF